MRFIRSNDPDELAVLDAVRMEAAKMWDEQLLKLARLIVKEQADAEQRGAKKRKRRK